MTKQIVKVDHFEVVSVSHVTEMKIGVYSISELAKIDEKNTKIEIVKIISKYLAMTSKVKNLNEIWFQLITDHILSECKNLELQEIDFIFKKGIMGAMGNNYQEIFIDTITGVDGWIENYYKNYRKLRPDPNQNQDTFQLTGKEITYQEFLIRNPEYASKSKECNIIMLAKNGEVSIDLLKQYFDKRYDKLVEISKEKYINAMNQMISIDDTISKLPKSEKEPFRIIKQQLKNILKHDMDEFVRIDMNREILRTSNNLKFV